MKPARAALLPGPVLFLGFDSSVVGFRPASLTMNHRSPPVEEACADSVQDLYR
jgi:hypothetical protein